MILLVGKKVRNLYPYKLLTNGNKMFIKICKL